MQLLTIQLDMKKHVISPLEKETMVVYFQQFEVIFHYK